ncbi:EGF-like domain-containing protein [Trichonephila clavipes]|nr:EGF-like domain-containing protein [Trichonephila clavipes]
MGFWNPLKVTVLFLVLLAQCNDGMCYNSGRCLGRGRPGYNFRCLCQPGYQGHRCQNENSATCNRKDTVENCLSSEGIQRLVWPARSPDLNSFKMSWILSRGGLRVDGDRFNSCQVIYSQFGLAIHKNDHQARRRFVEWAQNEIAVVPDFHKRILFSDEVHFWLNFYVNKQNCRIWSEANPQVYVETPLHPEKLTVWCALWAGGIILQKR